MLTLIGDSLVLLAAGALFPLMMLPLAALFRSRGAGALIFILSIVAVAGGSLLFAKLAVDIEPPALSPAFIAALGLGAVGGALLIFFNGAERTAETLAGALEKIVRRIGRLSLYLIIAMAGVQFAIVILRYVFGLNFISMQESVTYMHGAVFLLAGGYALLTDDHVRVDIFYREAPARTKALVDLGGSYLLLFPFCLVALWAAAPYVANSWAVREGSVEQSGVQGVYLLKALIPIYLTLLALAGFVIASRAAALLKSHTA